jgi:hypothetical protein
MSLILELEVFNKDFRYLLGEHGQKGPKEVLERHKTIVVFVQQGEIFVKFFVGSLELLTIDQNSAEHLRSDLTSRRSISVLRLLVKHLLNSCQSLLQLKVFRIHIYCK